MTMMMTTATAAVAEADGGCGVSVCFYRAEWCVAQLMMMMMLY